MLMSLGQVLGELLLLQLQELSSWALVSAEFSTMLGMLLQSCTYSPFGTRLGLLEIIVRVLIHLGGVIIISHCDVPGNGPALVLDQHGPPVSGAKVIPRGPALAPPGLGQVCKVTYPLVSMGSC